MLPSWLPNQTQSAYRHTCQHSCVSCCSQYVQAHPRFVRYHEHQAVSQTANVRSPGKSPALTVFPPGKSLPSPPHDAKEHPHLLPQRPLRSHLRRGRPGPCPRRSDPTLSGGPGRPRHRGPGGAAPGAGRERGAARGAERRRAPVSEPEPPRLAWERRPSPFSTPLPPAAPAPSLSGASSSP